MVLVVDIGNTHVVLGDVANGEIRSLARLATDASRTGSEYAMFIRSALELHGEDASTIEGAIISSVVPPVTPAMKEAIYLLSGREAMVVGAGIKTGLDIRIDDPAELGADLVVGAVGALAIAPPPLILIDMGTATTIFAVGEGNQFLGGAIIPGVVLGLKALAGGTSQLVNVNAAPPKKCISTNTVTCMQSGAIYGAAAMIDGMVERMEEELGKKASVIATGGLAGTVIPYCKREIRNEPELLLKGLAILWEKNHK